MESGVLFIAYVIICCEYERGGYSDSMIEKKTRKAEIRNDKKAKVN